MLLLPAGSTNRRVYVTSGGLARRPLSTAFLNNMAYEEHPALGLGFLEFSTRPAMSRAGPSSSVYIVWQRKQTNTAKLQLLVLLVEQLPTTLPRTGTVSGFPAQLSTVRIAGLTTSYTRSIVNYNIFSTTYGLMDSPFNDSVVYPCQISPLQYV